MRNAVIPFKKYNLLEDLDLLPEELAGRKLTPEDMSLRHDLVNNEWMINLLRTPSANVVPQKLFLYHEGEDGNFVHEDYPKYFSERGYEVLENPAPSLIIDVAKKLSENRQRLYNLQLSDHLNLTLLSTPPVFTEFGLECFLNAQYDYDEKRYKICLISADYVDCKNSIFILRKLNH